MVALEERPTGNKGSFGSRGSRERERMDSKGLIR